jgi:two-component system, NarL family, sensor kinase
MQALSRYKIFSRFTLALVFFYISNLCFARIKNDSLAITLKYSDSLKYSDPKTAFKYAMQGLSLAKKASKQKEIALAYSFLGIIKCIEGNYTESLNYHLEALKINEISDDKLAVAGNYNNIAMTLDNAGKDSAALSYYLKAIQIQENLNDTKGLLKPYNNLAILYSNTKQIKKAIEYFDKAAKIAHESNLPLIEGSIKHNIALIYLGESKYDKALELFMQSMDVHKGSNNDRGKAANLLYIGKTYFNMQRPEKGLSYMDSALVLAKEKGFLDIISESYLQLSVFFEGRKELARSLANLKLWAKTEEEIINEESVSKMAEMQTKYETEKKEKENTLLIDENKIKTLELTQKEQQRKILIGSFVLIMLLGGIGYNHYRLKNKNKILQERALRASAVFQAHEEEKIRISKDLHDGVGPLLSLIKLNISSLDINPSNEKIITKTKELASESIKEVRNISHSLMPGLLARSGLRSALTELVEQVNTEKLKVNFEYEISAFLNPEAELNIYRIIQEAVNNILKHAGATDARINLEERNQNVLISIRDNGSGFDKNKLSSSSGNGVNNIYSRIDLMKGKIEIEASDAGTVVSIQLPLSAISNG